MIISLFSLYVTPLCGNVKYTDTELRKYERRRQNFQTFQLLYYTSKSINMYALEIYRRIVTSGYKKYKITYDILNVVSLHLT
jgi:hypothetical protein